MAGPSLPSPPPALRRIMGATEYFTLAFGSIVGVGWVVLMNDWLERGGPAGAALGFVLGGVLLLPIGVVYGRLTEKIPSAAGEVAYTAGRLPPWVSFAAGWMMTFAYLIVCPFEAVSVGQIATRLFPDLEQVPLYQVAGETVHLPGLLMGLGLVLVVTLVNYRGIRHGANLQNVFTFGLLAVFLVFAALGLARGRAENLRPPFAGHGDFGAPLIATLLVLQIVPYYMAGFETIGKCSEERSHEFRDRRFTGVTLLALGVGVFFYTTVILVVALLSPWTELTGTRFATVVAFRRAFGSEWLVNLILLGAILSLIKVFNGCFLAATRLLFALGRAGLVAPRLGEVHARFQTPGRAIVFAGLVAAAGSLFGKSVLVPISEVGSFAFAVGWLAACLAYGRGAGGGSLWGRRIFGHGGALVALLLLGMKLIPGIPGSFNRWEYGVLAAWAALGWILWRWRDRRDPDRSLPVLPE